MKKLGLLSFVLFISTFSAAQAPAGSSLSFLTNGVCQLPTIGLTILCGQLSGDFQESVNGAAYKSLVGATGPQGPAGVAGATGPVGPQGPAGTMPANFTCTSISISSSGVVLSGCK